MSDSCQPRQPQLIMTRMGNDPMTYGLKVQRAREAIETTRRADRQLQGENDGTRSYNSAELMLDGVSFMSTLPAHPSACGGDA